MNRPLVLIAMLCLMEATSQAADRPNILFAISDDQSYPHASAYGAKSVFTPAFDRVAREGVLFTNAFTASPGCSPSRASILTGRYPWQNEHAGTHASMFSSKFATYPRLFAKAAYHVGYTGKGWGPGNFKDGGFQQNPAGKQYTVTSAQTPDGIKKTDYAASFAKFLAERGDNQPFCFWYGSSEPHRSFGIGIIVPALIVDQNSRCSAEVMMHNFTWSGCCVTSRVSRVNGQSCATSKSGCTKQSSRARAHSINCAPVSKRRK